MVLTFDEIMQAKDLTIEEVDVPEWSGSVGLRRMSAAQTIEMMSHFAERKKADKEDEGRDFPLYILSKTIADGNGNCPFDSDEGRLALGGKSNEVVNRLATLAVAMNASTKETVEEKAKNSEEAPAASSLDSPSDLAAQSENSSQS